MRGRFTPGAAAEEWCERRLLARIHRYTVKRLRAEIEPVAARDFLRFLFDWQRVAPDDADGRARRRRRDRRSSKVSKRRPALGRARSCRRARRLRAGLARRSCLAGRVAWARLGRATARARLRSAAATRCARRRSRCSRAGTPHFGRCLSASAPSVRTRARGASACSIAYAQHGALFFDEMVRRHRPAAHPGRGGAGRTGGAGARELRQLRRPARAAGAVGRAQADCRRAPPPAHASFGMEDAGRWALVAARPPRGTAPAGAEADAVEHVARTLLRRYGVVFWRLLEREADWLPPWRDLLRVYRRLEGARRDPRRPLRRRLLRRAVRAARSVGAARGAPHTGPARGLALRRRSAQPRRHSYARAELAALTGNRLLYRDGVPIALLAAGEVSSSRRSTPDEWEAHKALLRATGPERGGTKNLPPQPHGPSWVADHEKRVASKIA